jgi:hypothetical protein
MNGRIELRKFPYPFRAALAICSDVDNTSSVQVYMDIMDFLNGKQQTCYGPGLNLEVGNSFWFFNGTLSTQLSYFQGTDHKKETDFAPHCRALWQSGHLDALHTYGNFDTGGFSRKHGETALKIMQKYKAPIWTWVNHGSIENRQNLGSLEHFSGADRNTPYYHSDLLQYSTIRYAWMGRITHVIGQEAGKTLNIRTGKALQNAIFHTRHRRHKKQFHDSHNRLLIDIELRDGWHVWEFPRWINFGLSPRHQNSSDLAGQLHSKYIRTLERNEGFLIVYTHLCEGLRFGAPLPGALKTRLEYMAQRFHAGKLLVATTSRLLRYAEIHGHITFHTRQRGRETIVELPSTLNIPGQQHTIVRSDLQGLTFYCPYPDTVSVLFQGKTVPVQINPPDFTGRPSLSIPWIPLEYPGD